MSVRRTVNDYSHIWILLVDQSSCRHRVHLNAWRYFLDIWHYIQKMKFKCVGGILQKIISKFDSYHFGRADDVVETSEV